MPQKTILTSEHSQVTVGIVTYNSAEHIERCLLSIADQLSEAIPTVVILDNASHDNTLKLVRKLQDKFPFDIHTLPQDTNHGYAWGVNRIAEIAATEWLCFINPDASLLTPAYRHARVLVKQFPTCGAIGGVFVDRERKPQECGGVFPTPLMAVWDWCGLRHIVARGGWSAQLKYDFSEDAEPFKIDYPTGAFWMLRREVFQRVGPFDEQFFLYFEETDFCKRAKEIGWYAYLHPAIRIEHVKGASFDANQDSTKPDPLVIYFESLLRYLKKHFTGLRVDSAIWTIHKFLNFRNVVLKNEKSAYLLGVFENGLNNSLIDKNPPPDPEPEN